MRHHGQASPQVISSCCQASWLVVVLWGFWVIFQQFFWHPAESFRCFLDWKTPRFSSCQSSSPSLVRFTFLRCLLSFVARKVVWKSSRAWHQNLTGAMADQVSLIQSSGAMALWKVCCSLVESCLLRIQKSLTDWVFPGSTLQQMCCISARFTFDHLPPIAIIWQIVIHIHISIPPHIWNLWKLIHPKFLQRKTATRSDTFFRRIIWTRNARPFRASTWSPTTSCWASWVPVMPRWGQGILETLETHHIYMILYVCIYIIYHL